MRKILGYLSPEDHDAHLHAYALAMLAHGGSPVLDKDEAVNAIVNDQLLFGELRTKYDVPEDESVTFSLFDGAICEDPE